MTSKKNITGGTLTERAMLVDLSITYWVTHKKDEKIADDVTKIKHADHDAGSWWTHLLPPKAMSKVLSARARARAFHFDKTLPWCNDGARVLPAAMFFDYTTKMRELQDEYMATVEELLKDYPQYVASAAKRLGSMYKADYFPPANVIRTKFRWALRVNPLPDARDFRVDLGAEQTATIRNEIEAHTQQAMQEAMGDLWQRLYETVEHLAAKMKDTDAIFRDSVIGNVKDLCDLLPKMNVMQDANLETMRETLLAGLCKEKPEELRNNKKARAKTAKTADDILKAMEGFMARK